VKVLLVGEQIPGQLAWLCGRAFARLGATLAAVNTSGHPLERYRASPWPPLAIASNALQKRWVNAQLRRVALEFEPDLIFVTKGDELRAAGLARLKSQLHATLVNWNPDSPLNPLNTTPDLLDAIPIYDLYYTWGHFLLPELARLGAQRPCYLPFAYDPELHRPRELSEAERREWANDLVFVGTWEQEREAALEQLTGFDLGLWGNHWMQRLQPGSPLRPRWRGVAHGERLSLVYSASAIALNFVRAQNGQAHNMRTFEAPACGILLLASRTEEQVQLLGDGQGAVFFSSIDELRERAAYYLANPNKLAAVAEAGAARLAHGHTYTDRMASVLAEVERLGS
jgi:spore maturation protein CgeB